MATLTERAERALLGAMYSSPLEIRSVMAYTNARDFRSDRYQELFSVLKHANGPLPAAPPWDTAAEDRIARVTDDPTAADDLCEMADECPDPRHIRTYAAMVIEAGFRRSLAGAVDAYASGELDDLTRRAASLAQAGGPGATPAAELARHAESTKRAIRRHLTTFIPDTARAPATPAPSGSQAERDEELILGALVSGKADARHFLEILSPEQFGTPLRRAVFTAARTVYLDGHPADPLTVDWELARFGARRDILPDEQENGPSYAQTLAETALDQDVSEAAVRLIWRSPAPSIEPGPDRDRSQARAPQPHPEQAPPDSAPRRTLGSDPSLLQRPPDPPGPAQDPGPRR